MPDRRLRVLHLGFEDHQRPWAGGGSKRTHAINRELAQRHDVTVVCARYPGARARIEDGVRYVHVGLNVAPVRDRHFPSLLAYFAALPAVVKRADADLVVEDFASPFGSLGVPSWTSIPSVGVVQWLFAREKGAQYRLPFGTIEQWGLRRHRTLIAVSEDLGDELRRRNPTADVHVVPNGVDDEIVNAPREAGARRDLVYLGRLELAQKGLDLLIEAYAAVADRVKDDLLIAGDGTDEPALRRLVAERGLDARVRFLGRVDGQAKVNLLDGARALVVPSRYETFGLVAAEGLARATPVVAFDIPCLRQVVAPGTGILVPAPDGRFEPAALSEALTTISADPAAAAEMGARGPASVAGFRWSAAAAAQEDIYLTAARLRRQRRILHR